MPRLHQLEVVGSFRRLTGWPAGASRGFKFTPAESRHAGLTLDHRAGLSHILYSSCSSGEVSTGASSPPSQHSDFKPSRVTFCGTHRGRGHVCFDNAVKYFQRWHMNFDCLTQLVISGELTLARAYLRSLVQYPHALHLASLKLDVTDFRERRTSENTGYAWPTEPLRFFTSLTAPLKLLPSATTSPPADLERLEITAETSSKKERPSKIARRRRRNGAVAGLVWGSGGLQELVVHAGVQLPLDEMETKCLARGIRYRLVQ